MAADRVETISALLTDTKAAHGTYEAAELNGVYDSDWARWYAAYAVEHGIGERLGHDVATDRLAKLLVSTFVEFQETDPGSRGQWAVYTARRIAEEL